MSNRHGFLRGGIVSVLRRLSRFEPFFLSRNFRIHLRYQLGKLFFTFFSCFCVYIVFFLLSVGVGRRVPPFIEVVVYHGNASRAGASYFGLFRLEFCLLWRFYAWSGGFSPPHSNCPHFCRNHAQSCYRFRVEEQRQFFVIFKHSPACASRT